MNDIQLIRNIKKLNQIQPRKEFVISAKKEILGEDLGFGLFPSLKPVYAGLFCIVLVFGLFQLSQNALPGELLFQLKKITEKGQTMFSSEEERPKLSLFLANKRLMDLVTIIEEDQVQKLAPAVNEFKLKTVEVAKNLANMTNISKEIVAQVKELEVEQAKIEQVLATKIDTEEYDTALAQLVERELIDLEQKTLNENDLSILEQAKEFFEKNDYSEALIKILELNHY
ncbi:MAG: DUF5667 domain-containing protein [Candidatus Nealsonbacteria bacterium]